jgi:TonB family protein
METPLPVVDMRSWLRNLPEQLRASRPAPHAAPARFTSHTVAGPGLWHDFTQNPFSWANSVLIHLVALTAMVLPFALRQIVQPTPIPKKLFDLTHLTLTLPRLHHGDNDPHGGGGGGNRVPRPASLGALPPFARVQFTPPRVEIPKTPPLLPMQPTLLGDPALKLPAMKLDMAWGDPRGVPGPPSQGPGEGGGIGNGHGTGVGPGDGGGAGPGSGGGCCGDDYMPGFGGVTEPIAIYSPEPAYSEEARKAKYQGTVLLWIVVNAQGTVQNVRVAKHLGMGLDEEAVKTVSTWRFKPSLLHGAPVPVQVQVEVMFHLF